MGSPYELLRTFVFSSDSISRTLNAPIKKIWQKWCYGSSEENPSNTIQSSCGHLEWQLSKCFSFQTQLLSWENSKPHGKTSCLYSNQLNLGMVLTSTHPRDKHVDKGTSPEDVKTQNSKAHKHIGPQPPSLSLQNGKSFIVVILHTYYKNVITCAMPPMKFGILCYEAMVKKHDCFTFLGPFLQ